VENKKSQISYSQCPGECYDEFWEHAEDDKIEFNVKELFENYYKKFPYEYVITYQHKQDDVVKTQKHNTMGQALASAQLLLAHGDYVIKSVTTEVKQHEIT
jgi:hypothetical protein